MAYPTGSGSERLMRGAISAQSSTPTSFTFDGTSPVLAAAGNTVPALHIITLLSIVVAENAGVVSNMTLMANNGAVDIWLIREQLIPIYSTFVWNEKIVLQGGDFLKIDTVASADLEVWYTYIDQNWS